MLVILFILSLGTGYTNEIAGESRMPRCESRSSADPARLNIDSSAENFALSDPCRAAVQFYVAGNTNLRTVTGVIVLSSVDGKHVASESFELQYGDAQAGMLSETVGLDPIDGHMCRELVVNLSKLTCEDGKVGEIECPDVRLRTSYVFEDFTIDMENLNVCFD